MELCFKQAFQKVTSIPARSNSFDVLWSLNFISLCKLVVQIVLNIAYKRVPFVHKEQWVPFPHYLLVPILLNNLQCTVWDLVSLQRKGNREKEKKWLMITFPAQYPATQIILRNSPLASSALSTDCRFSRADQISHCAFSLSDLTPNIMLQLEIFAN